MGWLRGLGKTEALVASVTQHTGAATEIGQSRTQEWQRRAWSFWGRLGELHYPTSHLARLVSRIDWFITIDGEDVPADDAEDVPDNATRVADVMEELTRGMGQREAVRLVALNFQVAGELWYVRSGAEGEETWQVYSVVDPKLSEVRQNDAATKLRGMITDPRDVTKAESPFMGVIGPAEELLTLEALSRAQSRSRISQAGILFRPKEAQFATVDPAGRPLDPFGQDLTDAMTAPIADERDPSALVPMDVEVPADMIEKFRHMTFDRAYDEKIHERIERVTARIALGLDIPAELLLGSADLNHWTAWLLQDETYRSHVEPLAGRVGEVLSAAAEAMDLGKVVTLTPDPSKLLARRSTVRDAMDAAGLGAVGLAFVRSAIGATEKDKPTDEDLEAMAAAKGGGAPGDGTVEERPGPPAEDAAPTQAGGRVAGSTSASSNGSRRRHHRHAAPLVAASARELDAMGRALAELDLSLIERLVGASALAVDTARNRVGAKVRTKVRGSPEHAALADVGNAEVVATLGPRAFEVVDAEGTVRSSLASLVDWWREQLASARRQLASIAQVDTERPEFVEAGERSATFLADGLTAWTVETLLEPGGEGLEPPTDLVREVVAVAGGSEPAARVDA